MLLDRAADVFLAQRADADGWLVKPLDAFRLRQAATRLLEGYSWYEGVDERTNLPTGLPVADPDEIAEATEPEPEAAATT
jgi:hypothetical protein